MLKLIKSEAKKEKKKSKSDPFKPWWEGGQAEDRHA